MLLLISTIHVIVCLFLIMVVLLQQGKGADLSVFGGGGTQAAFGARGATTLLHKLTVIGFVGFILTTMAIGLLKTSERNSSVITDAPIAAPAAEEATLPDAAVETPAPGTSGPEVEEVPAFVEETPGSAIEAMPEAAAEDGGGEQ